MISPDRGGLRTGEVAEQAGVNIHVKTGIPPAQAAHGSDQAVQTSMRDRSLCCAGGVGIKPTSG